MPRRIQRKRTIGVQGDAVSGYCGECGALSALDHMTWCSHRPRTGLNNPKRLRHGDHGKPSDKEARHGRRRMGEAPPTEHRFDLVFEDEHGDLARCSCGEQGFDFNKGIDWFAEHIRAVARRKIA